MLNSSNGFLSTSNINEHLFTSLLKSADLYGWNQKIAEDISRKPLTYRGLIARAYILGKAFQAAFGIQTTPKTLFEASRTLGARTPFLLFRVAIPHAMPQIFNGITTACAGSFTCLVMAEMMGQPGGLGYYINLVRVWAAYYKVFAAILVMALLFSLILAVLNVIRDYVLRWQRGQFQ